MPRLKIKVSSYVTMMTMKNERDFEDAFRANYQYLV